jgi:hypothetical protein
MLTFLFRIRKPCFLAGFVKAEMSRSVNVLVRLDATRVGAVTTESRSPRNSDIWILLLGSWRRVTETSTPTDSHLLA